MQYQVVLGALLLHSVLDSPLTCPLSFFFFFNDTATTEIYTLSLHDALPICLGLVATIALIFLMGALTTNVLGRRLDRKSTRLNSSHTVISYAVFCLKKKKKKKNNYKIRQIGKHNTVYYK